MSHEVGSIIRARGREWVVLPSDDEEILQVRPLVGSPQETTGILQKYEKVEPATFPLPGPEDLGDFFSARLLRDAAKLSARSAVGPFRSLARINVSPRSYQIVPLLMALKLDPVRLLIADDVGIGKTIEALLIARELYDRGEITRFAVLCPPPLAEQWAKEMESKFHIRAELVLAGTAARLERSCPPGTSLFERHPFTVVSLDYIKSDRHRAEFLRTCPELVIVDEAHTCAPPAEQVGMKQQRYRLIKELAANDERHLLLVTATPHSGNEYAFEGLLELLDPTLTRDAMSSETATRKLAMRFVQRRRPDIASYLDEDTQFPERQEREATYSLQKSPEYNKLMRRAIGYVQQAMQEGEQKDFHRRVRWWSGLALLRALGSSPKAAAATMRNRAAAAATDDADEADEVGRRTVMDEDITDAGETMDLSPGAQISDEVADERPETASRRRTLLEMARTAEKISADQDPKLKRAISEIQELLKEGFHPIVFCRFVDTAHYVGEELRKALKNEVLVDVVTGELPPAERERRVSEMDTGRPRVLVATDCLSEGINLQDAFSAVVHYDLSWNPTRHEQREGRVDRFGQQAKVVRALTIYGADNPVDGLVLDVLIRKHKRIRTRLGVSVPVPMNTNDVLEALLEGLVLKAQWSGDDTQLEFPEMSADLKPRVDDLDRLWEASAEREKQSRSRFAQHALKPEEVRGELDAVRKAIGDQELARLFTLHSLSALNVQTDGDSNMVTIRSEQLPAGMRHLVTSRNGVAQLCFRTNCPKETLPVRRTSPLVNGLAELMLDRALSGHPPASRAGAVRTDGVGTRTTLLLVRYRYRLLVEQGRLTKEEMCEETLVLAYTGSAEEPSWLSPGDCERLLAIVPGGNVMPEQAKGLLQQVHGGYGHLRDHVISVGKEGADKLRAAHLRIRSAARARRGKLGAELQGEPDILGVYIFLPIAGGN